MHPSFAAECFGKGLGLAAPSLHFHFHFHYLIECQMPPHAELRGPGYVAVIRVMMSYCFDLIGMCTRAYNKRGLACNDLFQSVGLMFWSPFCLNA